MHTMNFGIIIKCVKTDVCSLNYLLNSGKSNLTDAVGFVLNEKVRRLRVTNVNVSLSLFYSTLTPCVNLSFLTI
jgi:hypothetical protein